jgi:antitoxin component of MazEF toxin-antitoxin module
MESRTRQVDEKGRTTLFQDFAGSTVTIERVGPNELRVRKVRANRRRYSLKELVAGITAKNRHAEVKTGRRVGGEAW